VTTTEIVALVVALCGAIAGPLAIYVRSSLNRVEAAADKTVASNDKLGDRIVAAIDRQTAGYSTVDARLARIEGHLGLPSEAPALSLVAK
jgi:hypothetical protein